MNTLKATLLDDDAVRVLAFPFSGPIPSPHAPRGVDLDGEWFSPRTDIKADWLEYREVDWQHGNDGQGGPPLMKRTTIGKAVDPLTDEEGVWVTVWLNHGERRLNLIKHLAERGAQLYGSSESIAGHTSVDKATGEILVWPYWRQTLSTAPQNTHSVLRPLKAVLDDATGTLYPATTSAFWRDITAEVRDLTSDLRRTSLEGDGAAKTGRVLSAVNAAALLAALEGLDTGTQTALERIREVLARHQVPTPVEPESERVTDA